MKDVFKRLAVCVCAVFCAAALGGCGNAGKCKQLAQPKNSVDLTYEQKRDDKFVSYVSGIDNFACKFAAETVKADNNKSNFAVSPVSAYMALALAAECTSGDTRAEILQALGTDYAELLNNFADLFNLLNIKKDYKGKNVSALKLTNSVWLNEDTEVNDECVQTLVDKFYAYSYLAPFMKDNVAANKAVKNFIKKQTNGLIDPELNLPPQTVFTLINTLYLKDVWNEFGDELRFSDEVYSFLNADGTEKQTKLMLGNYCAGRVRDYGEFKSFVTETDNGYRIKFILPSGDNSVYDVFTAENLKTVNSEPFAANSIDEENMIQYFTRCIFPEFSTSCNCGLKRILQNKFGIQKLFDAVESDFSGLTGGTMYCSEVKHITELKVDKKGIEGAAVTVIPLAGAPEPKYENVYEKFVIDKAFGFVLTDSNGVQLFAGIADKI